MHEFDFIETLLAPLAKGQKGALGLKDDAALLNVPSGYELVVTKDAMSEGVHFTGKEEAHLIAAKLLRVNLSDLAAMGAKPHAYFLALMLPKSVSKAWLMDFVRGLRKDQEAYGLTLMGGDTTRTNGPLTLSLTALGLVKQGKALKRGGAQAGDNIYVSGHLGDAVLGLMSITHKLSLTKKAESYLEGRYYLPEPRIKLGLALCGIATSCMDVSDGLAQDLEHILKSSHCAGEIECTKLPLSEAAKLALKGKDRWYETVLSGGDDYELLFTAPPAKSKKIEKLAATLNLPLTAIGKIEKGAGLRILDEKGRKVELLRKGYKHF